ncbi:homocysteine S-methyltransferase family protein [Helicovermis profundi]|uniref:Methionine synthase n=1 Tax=Helicovermis profundi TaxID=3065157 RepID=A0AAU9END7_9FIRM|nr:homocysteine S-methyltransferase family protein [Clostridia bacterium S502]
MSILKKLGKELIIFDGAMGTMLQANGLKVGAIPEELNIEHSDIIIKIHKDYIDAGANIITTNTFGANKYKLSSSKYTLEEIINSAVTNAKEASKNSDSLIAFDIGPVGKMMKPIGNMDFESAYNYFKDQVVIASKLEVDIFLIETMSDIGEMRAAVLAVKENSNLPVFATMTFNNDERTVTGTDPENMVLILESIGVDALGVNCSLGPNELKPIVKRILEFSKTPVIVQANAGLPSKTNGFTTFSINSIDYSKVIREFVESGVAVIGGCCGTNPNYVKEFSKLKPLYKKNTNYNKEDFVCTSIKRVPLNNKITIIGERINPSGNKKLKQEFKNNNQLYAVKEAFKQIENGAEILDINTSLPEIDEELFMKNIVSEFSGLVDAPLQIDSTKPKVIETALRHYSGVAIINSVNGKQKSMDSIFPLAKKYGSYVVALCFDEKGIPKTASERILVAEKLIKRAKEYGIKEERLLIDCLVLTASAQQEAVMETLKAIKIIKSKYNVKTTLGLSNVSYGLPFRTLINRTYFAMALSYGLDTVIIDPSADGIMDTLKAFNVLANYDKGAVKYIEYNENRPVVEKNTVNKENHTVKKTITSNIEYENYLSKFLLEGDTNEVISYTNTLIEKIQPLEIVNLHLIPSLDEIGLMYEKKEIFLPQLIRAAETIASAFEIVKEKILSNNNGNENISKGKIILATVEGDVHDIGKNLVKILLENYGYDIIDLGKDVAIHKVIEAIKKYNVKLVGLSALMTTTVENMETTIKEIRKNFDDITVFVGGAVLTKDYAMKIDADHYCKDARESVVTANEYFSRK